MRLERLGPSMTVLHTKNGTTILFSYETPVAALTPGRGYIKTDKWFSKTTSSHITKWLGDVEAEEVPHSEILELVEGC